MAENGNGDTTDSTKKGSEKYTQKYDLNEISPLRNSKEPNNDSSSHVNVNMTEDAADSFVHSDKNTNKLKGTYEALMTQLDISTKARLPFLLLIGLCAMLLIILIVLIAFWPRIPFYMQADICGEKECLDSSAQILLWANTSVDACQHPYAWACGKFEHEYYEHTFYGMNDGEWNIRTYADYEDIKRTHLFVAQLPTAASAYAAQSMVKGMHSSCMSLETLNKVQGDVILKNAIFTLLGWVYDSNWQINVWDFKSALILAQSKYGVFPFFKVSIENRNSAPFGNIIALSKGDVGLPHKMFYNLGPNHKITIAYQMLLRDFAINYGVVSDSAKKFADEIYHYEKRIVNRNSSEEHSSIITLGEIYKLAPSLPIFDTISTIFSNTQITEHTLILVRDVEMLRAMSIIVSTTDVPVLNSFITWSLSRHYLSFMSRDYRAALEEFESVLYGEKTSPPIWYFCTRLLKDWVPFAVDALRQNPQLIVTHTAHPKVYEQQSQSTDRLIYKPIDYNQELLKLIFYHLRHQFKKAIEENVLIDESVTNFINNKLSAITLQIGIPTELVQDDIYVNKYFGTFQWRKHNFLDNLESRWSFRKKKMEEQLGNMTQTDKIVAYLFPVTGAGQKWVQYSVDLNTIIVSEQALRKPYYHSKYPISVNFARIGVDLSLALLEATFLFGEQYKQQVYAANHINTTNTQHFSLGDTSCIESKLRDPKVPHIAKVNLNAQVTAGRFTAKAFKAFLRNVDNNVPIPDAQLADEVTYDLFGLRSNRRQAGLRVFDDIQLFSLAVMQRHCSVNKEYYKKFKPFINKEISESEIFDIIWDQIPALSKSIDCTSQGTKCDDLL